MWRGYARATTPPLALRRGWVNHRTLGEFRVDHGELLTRPLVLSITALVDEGLIDIDMPAQDGVRVRAAAGASSFRRRPRLWEQLEETKAALAELAKQVDSYPAASRTCARARRRAQNGASGHRVSAP